MGIASCGIVAQAPVSPSEQQFSRRRLQEDSAGEQMADGWNGDAIAASNSQIGACPPQTPFVPFAFWRTGHRGANQIGAQLGEERGRRHTSVMCRCHAGQERASQ